MSRGLCRFCGHKLYHTFIDLGMMPVSNAFITADNLDEMEKFYPLHAFTCEKCLLVQVGEYQPPQELFKDYAYFSSYSDTWLKHSRKYAETMMKTFGYNTNSLIIELASNDGYLLSFFKDRGIPVIGIEPAENAAKEAISKGIHTIVDFFGERLACELRNSGVSADLLIGNNVLAHVPDLNDFVAGMKLILKPDGMITMEFPHLLRLMQNNQFDTVYHEHFSYFSLITVKKVFLKHGLDVFDVEEIDTHGGSLRICVKHVEDNTKRESERIGLLLNKEREEGLDSLDGYNTFQEKAIAAKRNILRLLIDIKDQGKKIAGYGAPAKGNILLNYCGIRGDFIDYTVDRNPHKAGLYLPGTHIPVYSPDKIRDTKPDYVLILPWNIKDEIIDQLFYIREWGGRFILPVPEARVV